MSDSRQDSGDQERPARNDRGGERTQGSARGSSADRSSQDARGTSRGRDEKRPYGDHGGKPASGAKRPYGARDAKRPYGDRGGDRDAKRPYGDRDAKRPYGDRGGDRRPSGAGGRRDDRRDGRPDARRDHEPPRERHGASDLAVRPRHDDPEVPDRIEARDLDKGARAELKTLSKENADWVARHLAASEYLDSDPELAHRHAMSAARRGGRIAVVRETLAITAYATGDFVLALRELRTYRRISGSNDQLPLLVDSERGVGRPDRALEVGRSVDRAELPAAVQVGLAIAMSGARLDLEQPELALAELEIPQLDPDRAFSYSPALFSAYAEVLEELGRDAEATAWRARADRAEEALNPPAESEIVEIFEVELEEDEDEVEVPNEVDESREASESEPSTDEASAPVDQPADPGAVLEDDVAAVLAEGEALERGESDDSAAESATTDASEDGADGPVPHED